MRERNSLILMLAYVYTAARCSTCLLAVSRKQHQVLTETSSHYCSGKWRAGRTILLLIGCIGFLCLHLVISSDLLFRSAETSPNSIQNLSVRNRLQRDGFSLLACVTTDHLIEKISPFAFLGPRRILIYRTASCEYLR